MRWPLPCLLALLLAAPAAAQPAAPTAAATAAARTVADLLTPPAEANAKLEQQIADMRSGATFRKSLQRDPRLRAELARNSPAINAGIARIGALQASTIGPILRDMQANAHAEQINRLAREFTPAELAAIAAFYQSPAGQKFRQRQMAIVADVARANVAKFGPRLQAAEKTLAPRIQTELRQLFPPAAAKPAS